MVRTQQDNGFHSISSIFSKLRWRWCRRRSLQGRASASSKLIPSGKTANSADHRETPSLPYEVLIHIISCVSNKRDLKNVRLSSRLFAAEAEPRLFDTITLLPYRDFLDGFATFMKQNPRIAQHVQTVTYNAELRYLGNPNKDDEDDENEDVVDEDIMLAMRQHGLYDSDMTEEVSLVADCLEILPSVNRLHTIEANFDLPRTRRTILGSHHPYFRRLLGSRTTFHYTEDDEARGSLLAAAETAILALSQVSGSAMIRDLKILDADARWLFYDVVENMPNMPEGSLSVYREFFGQLKTLDLAFSPPSMAMIRQLGYAETLCNTREALGSILSSAEQLEQLHFEGPDDPNLLKDPNLNPESTLAGLLRSPAGIIRQHVIFPQLRVLELGNIACCAAELIALVRLHRQKLRKVVLYNVSLVEDPYEDARPCWVRTFKAIREFSVREVTISGEFSNLGSQSWLLQRDNPLESVDPESREHREHGLSDKPRTLKKSTEMWLSGQGDDACPIQFAAVNVEDGMELTTLFEELQAHVTPGDESWKFPPTLDEYEDELGYGDEF